MRNSFLSLMKKFKKQQGRNKKQKGKKLNLRRCHRFPFERRGNQTKIDEASAAFRLKVEVHKQKSTKLTPLSF